MNNSKELHSRLLAMMKDFHAFCVNNNIKYYMIGGTLLGARRHNGFIPWDDDVDIGLPREDYNRFIELSGELPNHLEIAYYGNTTDFPMHYIKLINNKTTLIEKKFTNIIEGLYIDIFPMDNAPSPYSSRGVLHYKTIHLLCAILISHYRTDSLNRVSQKILHCVSRKINPQWVHNILDVLATKHSKKKTQYIANFFGAWGIKEVVKKAFLGKPTLYQFEDTFFYGPEMVDKYLTCIYGDFMTPPPLEQRVFRHDYHFLDLDLPYREYKLNKSK